MKKGTTVHNFIRAKLYSRKGDLQKRWYVEFGAWNGTRVERRKVFCPGQHKTEAERVAWGTATSEEINTLLERGYCLSELKTVAVPDPVPATKPELSINEVFDIAIRKAQSLRKKSIASYVGTLNKYRAYLGPKASEGIHTITRTAVSEYVEYLMANDLTAATINNQLNITRIMINKAKKAEYITSNPFQFDKLTETENYSNVAFLPEHQKLMEEYLQEHHYPLYLLTRILYYNFIRPKELRDLRVSDFNISARTLSIMGGVAKNRKTNTIPIHPSLLPLVEHYRHYPSKFFVCGRGLKTGLYRAAENAAYNAHRSALEALGLWDGYGYTLYSWRHTGAVNAYLAGTDIKTLQHLFRHSSVVYTEIYLKSLKLQLQNVELKHW